MVFPSYSVRPLKNSCFDLMLKNIKSERRIMVDRKMAIFFFLSTWSIKPLDQLLGQWSVL